MSARVDSLIEGIGSSIIAKLEAEDARVYGPVAELMRRGGKRIRPRLALLSCGACGGRYEDALEDAAMIELFHEFTLIHDDVMDRSLMRRGAPTIQRTHGMGIAINSGDALYNLLWKWMLSIPLPPGRLISLQNLYAGNLKRVVDGQGVELDWERTGRFDITEKEYVEMALGKTSALMELSCGSGAFFADADDGMRLALEGFGRLFGLAFQISDDIDDLGSDGGEDIRAGKRTIIVSHAMGALDQEGRETLVALLSSGKQEDVAEARALLERTGSIAYARTLARRFAKEAKERLSSLPDGPDKEELARMADGICPEAAQPSEPSLPQSLSMPAGASPSEQDDSAESR